MREYKILLPTTDNDGSTLCHDTLLAYALDQFGGYTLGPVCDGGWHDTTTNIVYRDTVRPLFIATNEKKAKRFAEIVCAELKQECVYLLHPMGFVQFIYPATEETPCH